MGKELVDSLLALLFSAHEEVEGEGATQRTERAFVTLSDILVRLEIPKQVAKTFFERIPQVWESLREDAIATENSDPAATHVEEVILAYPGFRATAVYRLARELHQLNVPFLPRLMTEIAHRETGIDIHPGAQIGNRFVIDHGTGIVIGESTQIGDNVKLFQGVTLGALSVKKSYANSKRHPTIEDNVVIYANATILGGDTVIGEGSIIGGNAWITRSVPAGSTITRDSSS